MKRGLIIQRAAFQSPNALVHPPLEIGQFRLAEHFQHDSVNVISKFHHVEKADAKVWLGLAYVDCEDVALCGCSAPPVPWNSRGQAISISSRQTPTTLHISILYISKMPKYTTITSHSHLESILQQNQYTLVDFWATW